MFTYPKDYKESKNDLNNQIKQLKKDGYHIFTSKHPIIDDLSIDKVIIKAKKETKNRIILSIGLHGIEGYVGHSCLMTFLNEYLGQLNDNTEVVLYHALNPFGMNNFRRTNENNVDLNRNFTKNNFTSENENYKKLEKFFTPQKYKGKKTANLGFYSTLAKSIAKFGTTALKEATLLGQKSLSNGIYYSGETYQNSSKYILDEIKSNTTEIGKVVWIDLHTGYGPRYQMSIVNSQYEKTSTKELVEHFDYPLILGLGKEDFYDIDGDMLEMIYQINNKNKKPCDLFATCFEFGTLGKSTPKTIESLKAMIFENSSHFIKQSSSFNKYSQTLIREQFLPSEEKWRQKAYLDFKQAIGGILNYKNLI